MTAGGDRRSDLRSPAGPSTTPRDRHDDQGEITLWQEANSDSDYHSPPEGGDGDGSEPLSHTAPQHKQRVQRRGTKRKTADTLRRHKRTTPTTPPHIQHKRAHSLKHTGKRLIYQCMPALTLPQPLPPTQCITPPQQPQPRPLTDIMSIARSLPPRTNNIPTTSPRQIFERHPRYRKRKSSHISEPHTPPPQRPTKRPTPHTRQRHITQFFSFTPPSPSPTQLYHSPSPPSTAPT